MQQLGWTLKTLSERIQTQKVTYCMIPFIWNIHNKQIHEDGKQICSCLELGGNGNKEWLFNKYRVSSQSDENVIELHNSDGCTTLWNVLNDTELYIFKWLKR